MEFTLLFAVLTGVAASWVTIRLQRQRLSRVTHALDALIGAAAVGMVIGRLTTMIVSGTNPVTHPLDILIVRGGVDARTASLAAVLTLGWGLWPHVPEHLDALAPAALAGLAGWHGGCVWRGTCLGTASDLPWAYPLPGSDVTRHPVEIYAAVLLVVAVVAVSRLGNRPWLATGAALAAAALVRLLTEPMRPSLGGGPVWFYGVVLLVGAGLVVVGATGRARRSHLHHDPAA